MFSLTPKKVPNYILPKTELQTKINDAPSTVSSVKHFLILLGKDVEGLSLFLAK